MPHKILQLFFERKQKARPSYSLRALARDLKISPTYTSYILNGKKPLLQKKMQDFIRVLEIDDLGVIQLSKFYYKNSMPNQNISHFTKDFYFKYKMIDLKNYNILNNWYNLVILDFSTCKGFLNNADWIAKKLKIRKIEVEIAIESMVRLGFLEIRNNCLVKTNLNISFPTKNSIEQVRNFHKKMIKKAYDEIHTNIDTASFEKRLITGATFAISHDKIEKIKAILNENVLEIASIAGDGECENVYQLNIQFFPLT